MRSLHLPAATKRIEGLHLSKSYSESLNLKTGVLHSTKCTQDLHTRYTHKGHMNQTTHYS